MSVYVCGHASLWQAACICLPRPPPDERFPALPVLLSFPSIPFPPPFLPRPTSQRTVAANAYEGQERRRRKPGMAPSHMQAGRGRGGAARASALLRRFSSAAVVVLRGGGGGGGYGLVKRGSGVGALMLPVRMNIDRGCLHATQLQKQEQEAPSPCPICPHWMPKRPGCASRTPLPLPPTHPPQPYDRMRLQLHTGVLRVDFQAAPWSYWRVLALFCSPRLAAFLNQSPELAGGEFLSKFHG